MKHKPSNTTAVLIFANSAAVDAYKKEIPNSKKLFEALNHDILEKVKKTGLPYFLYDEQLQIGADFGARFTAAIQSVFAKGFDNIITVGNDTPGLTAQTISESYKNLQLGKTIIGPSSDGGVYLLGFHRNRFSPIEFRNLPWQKKSLFDSIAVTFLRKGMLYQLPRLIDLDHITDLTLALNSGQVQSRELVLILLKITRRQLELQPTAPTYFKDIGLTNPYNKGSPSLFY